MKKCNKCTHSGWWYPLTLKFACRYNYPEFENKEGCEKFDDMHEKTRIVSGGVVRELR